MSDDQQARLQALLAAPPLAASLFPPTSRYSGLPLLVFAPDSDRPQIYLRRRLVPQPEALALLSSYVVSSGERPDTIASATLGDPELFWRLCDANRALHPAELCATLGRRLRVPLPAGMPGGNDADSE
jgi:hypothetical protein